MKILKNIRALLWPHQSNGFKPHAIRVHGIFVALALVFSIQIAYNYQTSSTIKVLGYATNISINELLNLTNQNRASSGLSGLSLHSALNTAAQNKAQHMISNDYWAHVAPDGTTPWYFIESAGYSYSSAGENLAYGFATSDGVLTGWMNSPGHAANILDSNYQNVGFGIANGSNYQGGENTVVVAMYGQPTSAPVAAPDPTPAPTPTQPAAQQPVIAQFEQEPVAQSEPVEEEVEKEPQAKPAEEVKEPEEVPFTSQLYLARIDPNSQIGVNGSYQDAGLVAGDTITNLEAVLNGQAHWSLYATVSAMSLLAGVYFVRHVKAIYQIIIHGEHFIVGHPLLEASIIYATLWLLLVGTYGVIQ